MMAMTTSSSMSVKPERWRAEGAISKSVSPTKAPRKLSQRVFVRLPGHTGPPERTALPPPRLPNWYMPANPTTKSAAKALLASIKQSPIVRVGKPATERHLTRAEKELGVQLPGLYRELLKLAGQIDLWEMSMFGLGPSAERWEDYAGITVTELTQMARAEGNVLLPEHLVAIWHDCHQDYQCLDTRHTTPRTGDCPIVLFDPEIAASSRRPKRIAPGLAKWLDIRLKRALELKMICEADDADVTPLPAPRKRRKKAERSSAPVKQTSKPKGRASSKTRPVR